METRLKQRVRLNIEIIVRIPEGGKQKFTLAEGDSFKAGVLDISVLGIAIFSKYFLPRGLMLELEMPGAIFTINEDIKIRGEVRYSIYVRPSVYRCGIKFLDIPEKYTEAIARFVSLNERRKEPRLRLSD